MTMEWRFAMMMVMEFPFMTITEIFSEKSTFAIRESK